MWCWLLASCSHHASCLLLCLWCGKVPGGILGTLPHGAHQPREAHVLGFLQPTHQPLLHDGYELLITELPVPWITDRQVEEKTEGRQPVERWWNNSPYWWFPSVRVRQLRTVAVEQSEHHIAHVIRQLHFGNGARHLLHGDWGEEGGKHRQRNSPFVGWRNRGASHTIQLINVPMWRTLWAKQFGTNLEQGSCLLCRHMEEH